MAGAARYSAKRSSKDCIGFERTRAIAPFAAAPRRSKSAFVPMPASTSGAVMAPGVDGRETERDDRERKRDAERPGRRSPRPASHFRGTGYVSSLTESDARAFERVDAPLQRLVVAGASRDAAARSRRSGAAGPPPCARRGRVSFSITAPSAGSCDDAKPMAAAARTAEAIAASRPHDGSSAAASGAGAADGRGRRRGRRGRGRRQGRALAPPRPRTCGRRSST